jgi:capsular exopolysaccharide synthesis family protein
VSAPVKEPEAGTQSGAPGPDSNALGRPVPEGVDEHFASLFRPGGFEAEQYRLLRYTLQHAHAHAEPRVIAVTSPGAEDGKTTTAVNLAGTFAQSSGARVLLADADLRRPSVAIRLGMVEDEGPGLVGAILDGRLDLKAVVRQQPAFNLSVLPAGRTSAMPYELLQSPRLGELLDEARRQYDHVVVDTPPFLVVPDSRLLETWVDGFVVVVAANKTHRHLVEETLNEMAAEKVLGLVFNRDERLLSEYYRTYQGYYYGGGSRHRTWRDWF